MPADPAAIRFQCSGVDFVALEWGPTSGPLAICVHGYPDTAWTWRFLGPELARRGWHVVAPFTRGYAPSGLAPDGAYGIGPLVRDVIAMHEKFSAGRGAVLVGHDFGAGAAYVIGASRPELFSRIITLAVPPLATLPRSLVHPRRWPAVARQLRRSWYVYLQLLPILPERLLPQLVPKLWALWSPGYEGSADIRELEPTLGAPARRRALMRYYRQTLLPWCSGRAYAGDSRGIFSPPAVPVLYLHGANDRCVTPSIIGSSPEVLPPGSRYRLIPNAGHFLHIEEPSCVNTEIVKFLESAEVHRGGGSAMP